MKILCTFLISIFTFHAANAASNTIFSLFGREISAREMHEKGELIIRNVDCAAPYDPLQEEDRRFARSMQDVYPLRFTSNGANIKLKIETDGTTQKISIQEIEKALDYSMDFKDDYASAINFALCCSKGTNGLSGTDCTYLKHEERNTLPDEDGTLITHVHTLRFAPCTTLSIGNIIENIGLSSELDGDIFCSTAGYIRERATSFQFKTSLFSATETILEATPISGINPIIRSIIITAPEEIVEVCQEQATYYPCLIDGHLDSNTADISIYNFKSITFIFDASIIGE